MKEDNKHHAMGRKGGGKAVSSITKGVSIFSSHDNQHSLSI